MDITNKTYHSTKELEQNNKIALRMMLYIGMASITMFFAVSTSALILKKADVLNWAQFPLPSVFTLSTIFALLSSVFFYLSYSSYKKTKFALYRALLFISSIISIGFLITQLVGFQTLTSMDFPIAGNVSGSYIYFLAIVHALHILVGLFIVLVVWIKSYRARKSVEFEGAGKVNPNRVLGLELLTTYWHFVNALWVYLFIFFYFNYQ